MLHQLFVHFKTLLAFCLLKRFEAWKLKDLSRAIVYGLQNRAVQAPLFCVKIRLA